MTHNNIEDSKTNKDVSVPSENTVNTLRDAFKMKWNYYISSINIFSKSEAS